MPCGWEGNRRSGVALACVTDFSGLSTCWAHRLRKGDEHPAYSPHGVRHSVTLSVIKEGRAILTAAAAVAAVARL